MFPRLQGIRPNLIHVGLDLVLNGVDFGGQFVSHFPQLYKLLNLLPQPLACSWYHLLSFVKIKRELVSSGGSRGLVCFHPVFLSLSIAYYG